MVFNVKTTASVLARAVFDMDVAEFSRGFYEGTRTRLRAIPPDAPLTVSGTSSLAVIEDAQGAWIAERFGLTLGARQIKRLLAGMKPDSTPMPIPNPGPRGIARAYVQGCGWKRADALKLIGKKWRKGMASPRRALTADQQRVFLAALASGEVGQGCAGVLLLALVFGLRIAEATALTTASATAAGLRVFGKGQKWRTVSYAVDPRSRAATGVLHDTPLASAGACQRACRKLAKLHRELSALTPHVLRHTFATDAVARCVDPQVLQAALGHDKFATTITYLQGIGAV